MNDLIQDIDQLMQQGVETKVFPGASLLVAIEDTIEFQGNYGFANIYTMNKVDHKTVWDLASLTKPLATTLAIVQLVQKNKISIEDPIENFIGPFSDRRFKRVTIRNLLCHNSGLVDYRTYYKQLDFPSNPHKKKMIRKFLLEEEAVYPVGEKVIYSDLGFMMLEWIVEKVSGNNFGHFLHESVYNPLNLDQLYFIEDNVKPENIEFAATEFCSIRNCILEGVVHDENAFISGGINGHAGLFGCIDNVYKLLRELIQSYQGKIISCVFDKKILGIFFQKQKDSYRALGFDRPSRPHSSSGQFFSENSVGHLGFTGTSFWIDLDKAVIIILLTNRVHYGRNSKKIIQFRPKLHDLIMKQLISSSNIRF